MTEFFVIFIFKLINFHFIVICCHIIIYKEDGALICWIIFLANRNNFYKLMYFLFTCINLYESIKFNLVFHFAGIVLHRNIDTIICFFNAICKRIFIFFDIICRLLLLNFIFRTSIFRRGLLNNLIILRIH